MTNQERIRRIQEMEAICDRAMEAVKAMLAAAENFRAVEADIQKLENYYMSQQWLADRDVDQAGEIPQDLKRGILAEDTICDLLTDIARMKEPCIGKHLVKDIVEHIEESADELLAIAERNEYEKGQLFAYAESLCIIRDEYAGYDLADIGLDYDIDAKYLY